MTRSHNFVMNEKMTRTCWDIGRQVFVIRFAAPKEDYDEHDELAFNTWTLDYDRDKWEQLLSIHNEPLTVAPVSGVTVPSKARIWMPAVEPIDKWLDLPYETQIDKVRMAMQDGCRVRPWTLGSIQDMIHEAEKKAPGGKSVGIGLPAGPRKPVPALPAESNTLYNVFKPFDPKCAWNATRIAAGDPPRE